VAKVRDGIEFADTFKAACELGHEGIVAKRKDLACQCSQSKRWLKIKNSPAAQRIEDATMSALESRAATLRAKQNRSAFLPGADARTELADRLLRAGRGSHGAVEY
jgi:hypothetical protein